jgi:Asp-tRNA(Asn)/Glu-tRNA(Gln) amidotransferase A subunit family amidase
MDLAGVPALSLPCGFAERGWTVSMTLSAARGRDDVVLALGEAWEEAEDRCYSNRTAAIPNGPM